MWIHLVPLELIDGASDVTGVIGTPIQTSIINAVAALIPQMTVANGYSQDYGSVNEYDPDSRVYPATFLDTINEEAYTGEGEKIVDRYTVEAPFVIETIIATESDIHERLNHVIADFGKMFASNEDVLQTAGMIWYQYRDYEIVYTNIQAYPAKLVHIWDIQYRRQKIYPYLT